MSMTRYSNPSRSTSLADSVDGAKAFISRILRFESEVKKLLPTYGKTNVIRDNFDQVIEHLLLKFHAVAKQLEERHEARSTIRISDEYDAQDLLHALLKLHFEDVRKEEWTPSHAGGSSRMDFLLKNEQAVVEVKKTRKGLNAKKLGDELIIDREHYKKHPDCSTLYCLVYDPEEGISNPRGLERDLSEAMDGFSVKVFVIPRR